MNPTTMMMIMLTVFLGPIITMLSHNLLLMWTGLELSLLAIIPVLMSNRNPRATEASTKYFTTQATASMLFLLSILLNFYQLGTLNFQPETHYITINLTLMAMAMKLGLAPFHHWLPEVSQGVSFKSNMILLTWQKIAPLSILYQIYQLTDTKLILLSAILSILVGGWNGLNQTQTRKIMAFSSIAHMGWMVAILPFNPTLMLLNLIIYIIMTLSLLIMMSMFSLPSIKSMTTLWNKFPITLPIMATTLLSLGGLPPLTGFMPKWAIITEMLKNNNTILATMMAIMALLNLFFYIRLIYTSSLTTFPSNNNIKITNQQKLTKNNPLLPPLIILSIFALPITPQLIL